MCISSRLIRIFTAQWRCTIFAGFPKPTAAYASRCQVRQIPEYDTYAAAYSSITIYNMRRLLPLVHPFDPLQPNSMHFPSLLVFVALTLLTSTRASPVSHFDYLSNTRLISHLVRFPSSYLMRTMSLVSWHERLMWVPYRSFFVRSKANLFSGPTSPFSERGGGTRLEASFSRT